MEEKKDLLSDEGQKDNNNPYQMNGPYVQSLMILTDDDLVSQDPVQWSGFGLKCKKCGVPAILHFMKYCGNCGEAASIQSNKANDYVKKIQENYNGRA